MHTKLFKWKDQFKVAHSTKTATRTRVGVKEESVDVKTFINYKKSSESVTET